jgi:hypothetical protein
MATEEAKEKIEVGPQGRWDNLEEKPWNSMKRHREADAKGADALYRIVMSDACRSDIPSKSTS